jgi:hypothetical protein
MFTPNLVPFVSDPFDSLLTPLILSFDSLTPLIRILNAIQFCPRSLVLEHQLGSCQSSSTSRPSCRLNVAIHVFMGLKESRV